MTVGHGSGSLARPVEPRLRHLAFKTRRQLIFKMTTEAFEQVLAVDFF
jgi:hypothetical protein